MAFLFLIISLPLEVRLKGMNNFYQWPPCRNCESVFPRAVLIQRICNLAGLELNVINVHLPKPGEELKSQLENRLVALPYLEMDGENFKSSRKIWDHLLLKIKVPDIRNRLIRTDSVYSFITQQWCNESFINSLVYARWKREENFKRFITGVEFGQYATPESIDLLRKAILKYLSRTPIGDYNDEAYHKMLIHQFSSLAKVIDEQQYFETFAKHPTFTDLNVFMVVQGFLSPDLQESVWIENTYPSLMKWYRNMELYTQKNSTPDLLGNT